VAGLPPAKTQPELPGVAAIGPLPQRTVQARRELPLAGPVPQRQARTAEPPPGEPSQPTAPLTAGIVQRAAQAMVATAATPPPTPPAPPSGEAGAAKETPAVDLEALARQVYEILRRRLRVERERSRGGA